MKIIFYIDSLCLGGAQRVMSNLVNYFASRGNSVILVNDYPKEKGKKEYQVDSRTDRRYIQKHYSSDKLKSNLKRLQYLRTTVKEEKPDVVLSFLAGPNIRLLISTIGMKVPKIVSVRNDPSKEYGVGIKRTFANLVFNLASGCVFQTNDAKKYFNNRIQKRSTVIFNPVEPGFYNKVDVLVEKTIAVVGRLTEQKNPKLAIRAFSQIVKEFPDYKLCFYGDGELRHELETMAEKLGVKEKVVFYGQVDDVQKRLLSSTVYILTSDYEGMPNALMEAMAVGVPCISTDCPIGGPRALIENEEQGILIPCGDEKALSDALRKLLSDPVRQEKMREAERERANQFRPEIVFKEWERFIKKVIYAHTGEKLG